MKKLAVITVIVGLVGAVQADYFINFSSYWGTAGSDGTTGIIPKTGDKALVQLIFAGADGIANELEPGKLDLNALITGDDVLLYEGTFENTGGLYEDFAGGSYGVFDGAAFLGGAVYGRIFSTDVVGEGASYFIAEVGTMSDLDSSGGGGTPPLANDYNLNPDALGVAAGMVIPEPATFGLMGIAGLGMFLARKKARR